jgi:hypothetical protein
MASYDAASNACLTDIARRIIKHILNPRSLSEMASSDAASNVCLTVIARRIIKHILNPRSLS